MWGEVSDLSWTLVDNFWLGLGQEITDLTSQDANQGTLLTVCLNVSNLKSTYICIYYTVLVSFCFLNIISRSFVLILL